MKTSSKRAGLLTCLIAVAVLMTPVNVKAQEIAISDANTHNSDIPVSITVNSNYTVSLPASVALSATSDNKNLNGDMQVRVKGIFGDTEYVKIDVTAATTEQAATMKTLPWYINAGTVKQPIEAYGSPAANKIELELSSDALKKSDLYAVQDTDDGKNCVLSTNSTLSTGFGNSPRCTQAVEATHDIKLIGPIPSEVGVYNAQLNITYQLK